MEAAETFFIDCGATSESTVANSCITRFYIIADKTHEREIENVILRAASPQLVLNQRKVRDGIEPGSVKDYEPGTRYYRRKLARGERRVVRFRRARR
jgi:hypothetical protein